VKTTKDKKTHTMIAQRQENKMSTEQQIKSAIDTLNEALELMQKLGLVTEEEDEDATL
jgi:DNA-binding protein H-NS